MTGFRWTDADVRRALGLSPERARAGREFSGVSTDSRTVEPGALYVALVGERFDGHDFVADALARGAAGAVVAHPVPGDPPIPLYPVEDTLVALGALARYRRAALNARVVGITGSVGKTTTKDLAAAAVAEGRRVHATRGNLNNRIGLPLTLLEAPDDAEVVVLEMGTNEPGEIETLARIAEPHIGVITTVGPGHLEGLASVEGVLEEKLGLLRNLPESGVGFVGDEPPELAAAARDVCSSLRVAGWGERADADLRPADVEVDHWGGHTFTWKGRRVSLAVPGAHAVVDALLALGVAEAVGLTAAQAARGIAAVRPGALRGEVRHVGGLTLLVDCYNANPQSVRAALDLLEVQAVSRRVAVLGSMLELGEEAAALHREALRDALQRDVALVVATGLFADAAAGFDDPRLLRGREWRECYDEMARRLHGDEVVLLKASRGVALEAMLPLLERDFGENGGPAAAPAAAAERGS